MMDQRPLLLVQVPSQPPQPPLQLPMQSPVQLLLQVSEHTALQVPPTQPACTCCGLAVRASPIIARAGMTFAPALMTERRSNGSVGCSAAGRFFIGDSPFEAVSPECVFIFIGMLFYQGWKSIPAMKLARSSRALAILAALSANVLSMTSSRSSWLASFFW